MSFLHDEIFEQPQVLRQLIETEENHVAEIAALVHKRRVPYVVIAARGSSDHAALYAKYLLGSLNHLPVALATPSLFTMYHSPPRLKDALVIGISQSGQSTDIVSVVSGAREQGALTLAITNDTGSPLAQAAEHVLPCHAGVEKSLAATKTYTAQLVAVALLATSLAEDKARLAELRAIPDAVEKTLTLSEVVQLAAERYRYMEQCVVLGRGYNYATAYEVSLKLKELTYVVAEPYSSADFVHGPIAIVERGFPVIVIVPHGAVYDEITALARSLQEEWRAELIVISDRDEALSLAKTPLWLPVSVDEWLSPMLCIIPGQLFAYHLTLVKGFDPDHPRGLRKVTITQ
ncbi:MAG: SIS domain-containing protein [Anaerolineae bacterium]|jgi:glucosamine--fructose-6-phosphate aminotransferase (isomerizing)|nr:SIS domain-containing protein [Anaerolineae bacterium]MDH7472564.1 SIS domain-containing protein [Anaerolineae bacterium]